MTSLSASRALAADKNLADAYFNRGVAYCDTYEYDSAIADYTEAIRINPNHADVYFNRGVAYASKADFDRAIADWETVLRFEPNNVGAKDNLDFVRLLRGK